MFPTAAQQKEKQILFRPRGFTALEHTLLNEPELRHLAAHMRGKPFDRKSLETALKEKYGMTLPRPGHQLDDGDCGTPFAMLLYAARLTPGMSEALRDDIDRMLDIDPAYTVQTYNTANFTFRYTTDPGSDQVTDPTLDTAVNVTLYNQSAAVIGTTVAGNGVPNYVERLGIFLEYALGRFIAAPYSFPNPASGGRILSQSRTPRLTSAGWTLPPGPCPFRGTSPIST